MAKKIRVWDGTQWQDVAPALPYTAVHSAQASMPSTGVDGQIWLDTDGTLSDTQFVPLAGGTMTGNLNVPSINSGPIVGRNKILNGDFGIWQRGTTSGSTSIQGVYVADRFFVNGGFGTYTATYSRQSFTPGTAPISGYEAQYFARLAVTAASATGLFGVQLCQYIEDVRTFAGQTITVSFWAKAASNINGVTVGVGRNYGAGGSSPEDFNYGSFNVTTSWQRFSTTFEVASVLGKTIGASSFIGISIALPVNTTGTIDIWGVQAEAGNQATPFHTATPNQQTELAACQRYYEKSYLDTVAPGTASDGFIINGFTQTSGQKCMMGWRWTVRKRSTPTVTIYDRAGNSGKLTVVDIGGTPTDNQAIALISSDYNGLNYLGANNGTHTGFRFNWVADAEL